MVLFVVLLTIIFGTLLILYDPVKWGLISEIVFGRKGKDSLHKGNTRNLIRIRFFRVTVPVIDGLYTLYLLRKNGISVTNMLTDKIGQDDIGKLPFGSVSVLFSKDAKKVLSSVDPGHLSRPDTIYDKFLVDILEGGLLRVPYDIWNRQRKIVAKAFTFRMFQSYIVSMNKYSKRLAMALSMLTMVNKGQIMGKKMNYCIHLNTFMITMEFVMGSQACDLKEARQVSKDFDEIKEIVLHRFFRPQLYIPFIWWFDSKRKRYNHLVNKLHAFMRKIIRNYEQKVESQYDLDKSNGNSNRCLIEEMIKQKVPQEEMFCQISTFLFAGHETISTAVKFLLHHLACHPEYQARCRAEVDRAMEHGADLTLEDLSKLEYLERFVQESLRIAPTVPFAVREINSPLEIDEGCTIGKGNLVIVPAWFIHHNPKYYPQPEIFDPDRFLPEETRQREPGTFIPFSGGMRNCIGRRFAMLEMKCILAWTLRNFEVHTEDRLHNVRLFFDVALRPERDFRTILKTRNIMSTSD